MTRLLILISLVGVTVGAEPTRAEDYAAAMDRLRDAVRHEVASKKLPAFSIALVDGDGLVWSEGFGHQDAENTIPATGDTVYRVGSVSKLFTDIAVMRLAASGQLDIDAPIADYLPDFQPKNRFGIPLTLRLLMSHQSGLVRESPVGNYFDPDEPSLAETVASLNETALVYEPATRTKYSNAAIAVVGAVLESQLESSHPEHVRKTILTPLGMAESGFVSNASMQPRLATGWMWTLDGRRFEAPDFLLGTGPAGNLYSSVNDLGKFLTCLFDEGETETGQLISPEVFGEMITPIKNTAGEPQGFGIGFAVGELDGHQRIGHGGAVYGFSTQLEALPERKLGVAAASSLDGSNGVVRRLAFYALRLMLAVQDGESLPSYRTSAEIDRQRARQMVGTYREIGGDRTTQIFADNEDLFMRRGTFRYRLGAASDDGAIITDDVNGFGMPVRRLDAETVRVGDTRYERVEDVPPGEAPPRWQGLIGEYGWDHNTLYILEDAGRLYALIEWFYYYPLTELDENTFAFPDYGLYHGEGLKFARDAEGRATAVTAAEVTFVRREVGTRDGKTFRITPVAPIDDLRAEAMAASPPEESGEFRDSELVEVRALDETIQLDVRYATTNNFTGARFYRQPLALMQRPAAEAVVRAHRRLAPRGLGLLIHDAYRPWHVTKMFWDATPNEMKDFVANPAFGSRHNRGCAVDLTLFDRTTGEPIRMVAGYDEFSQRSFPLYPGGTARQRWYRDLLRRTMEAEEFSIYEFEWWHFDYRDWRAYRLGNSPFEELKAAR